MNKMQMLLLLIVAFCACPQALAVSKRSFYPIERTMKPISDPIIQEAAAFAVHELQQLSDTGIYKTLELDQIHEAAAEIGDFHYVIHLKLALASPHFQSQRRTEDFHMMVMEPKDTKTNATRSLAIDTFPQMDEDAIEAFWIEMVEERRRQRNALLNKWLQEEEKENKDDHGNQDDDNKPEPPRDGVQEDSAKPKKKKKKTLSLDDLERMSTKQLRRLYEAPESTPVLRDAITNVIDARWEQLQRREEAPRSESHEEL